MEEQNEKKEIETFMQKLERQRDELLLQIHLAKAEAKDEWDSAEKKWDHLKAKTPAVAKESGESLKDLGAAVKLVGEELMRSYERIKKTIEK
jgi:broad specificity phosphatase PhoE